LVRSPGELGVRKHLDDGLAVLAALEGEEANDTDVR